MTSCRAQGVGIVMLWLALHFCPAVHAQPHGSHGEHSKPRSSGRPESLVLEMLNELEDQASAILRTGEDVDLRPVVSRQEGDDLWSSVLQITRVDNPFITRECRLEAVNHAKNSIGGVEQAKAHAGPHFEEWKEVLRGDRRISLNEYLNHILFCKDFCSPLIGSLLKCHVQGVSQASYGDSLILRFGIGVPRRGENFEFSSGERSQIVDFARSMRAKGKRVLVEARASILDETESLHSNLELSQRRGDLMRRALINAGFPSEHILVKSLCWEPPRLAIEEVATAYGFASVRASLPNPQYMDQSVVLLGY